MPAPTEENSSQDQPDRTAPQEALDALEPLMAPADIAPSVLDGEDLSKTLIANAIRKRLNEIDMTLYELEEHSGVSMDVIMDILSEQYDIGDFEPVLKIESTIRTSLRHL